MSTLALFVLFAWLEPKVAADVELETAVSATIFTRTDNEQVAVATTTIFIAEAAK